MSIRRKDIAKAATSILKKEFTDRGVYSDEEQEGFAYPAFFIEILQKTSNERLNLNSNLLTVIITYLPEIHDAIDDMDTADRIRRAFGLTIPVEGRVLKIGSFETAQTGEKKDILQVYLRLEYYEAIERVETNELMQKLHYRNKRRVE